MLKLFSYKDPMDDAIWINDVAAKITKNILRISWHDLLSSNEEVREEAKNFFCSPLDEKNPFFWREESAVAFRKLQKFYLECDGDIAKIKTVDGNIERILGLDPEE